MRNRLTVTVAALALGGSLLTGSPAEATPTVPVFQNCTAMHEVYRYGVARTYYAATHARPPRIRMPKISKSIYRYNARMDRDKDGVACEVSR